MHERLESFFADGSLVRLSDNRPNLVHLVRAIATIGGVEDLDAGEPVRDLVQLIGDVEHLIFVLLDGLGMNLVRKLPPTSFMQSHLKAVLTSTCPSTTACALTSIATAQYANRHGISGWFTHLPEFGVTATVLPFIDRFTGEPLGARGITPETLLKTRPILPRMTRRALTIVPSYIANTTYNTFARGGTEGRSYHAIPQAIEEIILHVRAANEPTYTHLYLPEIDTVCHKLGVDDPGVMPVIERIDAELIRLHKELKGKGRLVVSADHGLIDVPREQQTLLMADDPLLGLLEVPPSGDARMPIFHVRAEREAEFIDQFAARFSQDMVLVKTSDAQRMELFGPGPFSEHAGGHFGNFIGIPFRAATLALHPPGKPLGDVFRAVHAGLSPEEMWVPLSVA